MEQIESLLRLMRCFRASAPRTYLRLGRAGRRKWVTIGLRTYQLLDSPNRTPYSSVTSIDSDDWGRVPLETMPPNYRLFALRWAHGHSQVSLAHELGMQQAHISNLESGRRRPGPRIARRYAMYFGCDYRKLL